MGTVVVDAYALKEVRTRVSSLAGTIEREINSANVDTPVSIGLPDHRTKAAVQWLRDQDRKLMRLIDLAYLLDKDGYLTNGQTPTIPEDFPTGFDGSLDSAEDTLSDVIADKLKNLDDMDSTEDREEMERFAEIYSHYRDDPEVSSDVVSSLGPEETVKAMYAMQAWLTEQGQPNYYTQDNYSEREAIFALQDSMATTLAGMVGTASRNGGLPDDFGRLLVESDGRGWGVATLMDYGDEPVNYPGFGKDFLVDSGTAMIEWERRLGGGGSQGWDPSYSLQSYPLEFGTDRDDDSAMNDPTLQWLQVLDKNPDASQEILLNEDLLRYLLKRESDYEDPDGKAAGNVLRAATVDQANGFDPRFDKFGGPEDRRAHDAAVISANVLDIFGEGDEAQHGADEEIAGIISTYIADVDRTVQGNNTTDGDIYSNGENLPDWLKDRGLPYYGIEMTSADLRDLLHDIGDNETARSIIGSATQRFNTVRMNSGAYATLEGGHLDNLGSGDAAIDSITNSAQLSGFLQDAILTGDINAAEADAEDRRKLAQLFTMPLDLIPTGKTGPVGGFLIGEIKDQIIDGYVGDGVPQSISHAEGQFGVVSKSTKLQGLYAMLSAETTDADGNTVRIPMGGLRDDWPRDANGDLLAPAELSDNQINNVLQSADNDSMNSGSSNASVVGNNVDGAIRDLIQLYGDK